jgi:hypothetical protein
MRRIIFLLIVILFAGCGKVPTSEPDQSFEHFTGDFENGNLNGFHLLVPDTAINTVIVSAPVRKGNYALRNTLRPNDYVFNGYRSELAVYNCAKYKTEVYYGMSIMIDTAYVDNEFNLISQWQDLPNYLQGEDWATTPILHGSSPPMALVYVNGSLELRMNQNPNTNSQTFLVGNPQTLVKGLWYDLVFHIYWSDDNSAYVEAWINGNYFTPFNGADNKFYGSNIFTRTGNYFKFGQYRGKDKTANTNIIYFDEVKVGTSYNEVAP